jgi:HAD superfamily hydrolase (TIGR01459 family)
MPSAAPPAPVPIIAGARDLLARYDLVISDVWGVVHNGVRAYEPACAALVRYRRAGGRVVLLSNAPGPAETVSRLLDQKGVPRDAWDALVTSGDITRAHLAEAGYARIHHVGPDRDLSLFDTVAARRVGLAEAEAMVVTGLVDDANEEVAHYRPLLEQARQAGLPFVCANPDLVVEVAGRLYLCAGSLAALYEELGGDVLWAGKPFPVAYETAAAAAGRVMGRTPGKARTLAIGDAVRTDLAGAAGFGVDALFIGHGIHRDEIMPAGVLDRDRMDALLARAARPPVAAMAALAW